MDDLEYPPVTATPRTLHTGAGDGGSEAEDAWEGMRKATGVASTDRHVQRLHYNHASGVRVSEVGFLENDDVAEWLTTGIYEPAEEHLPWAIAIMRIENGAPVWRNPPILVASNQVLDVIDFLPT